MELLEPGQPPEEQPRTAVCAYCKARHRFRPAEAEYISDARDGDFYRFACMTCRRLICVSVDASH